MSGGWKQAGEERSPHRVGFKARVGVRVIANAIISLVCFVLLDSGCLSRFMSGPVRQFETPLGHQARGRAMSVAPVFMDNPDGCLGR